MILNPAHLPLFFAAVAALLIVRALFAAGLLNNLLNPKALLLFSVFIPQFIDPARGAPALQLAALGLLLTVIATLYNLGVAVAFGQMRRLRLAPRGLARHGEGLIGALFLLLAGRLAATRV